MNTSSDGFFDELRCRRVVMVDSIGKTRALFESTDDGNVSINLYNQEGVGISISVDAVGDSKINFYRKNQSVAIAMGVSNDLGSGLSIHAGAGELGFLLAVSPENEPSLKIFQDRHLIYKFPI